MDKDAYSRTNRIVPHQTHYNQKEMSQRPEDKAREAIDNMLAKSGWHVKDDKKIFKRTERLRQILLKVLLKEY